MIFTYYVQSHLYLIANFVSIVNACTIITAPITGNYSHLQKRWYGKLRLNWLAFRAFKPSPRYGPASVCIRRCLRAKIAAKVCPGKNKNKKRYSDCIKIHSTFHTSWFVLHWKQEKIEVLTSVCYHTRRRAFWHVAIVKKKKTRLQHLFLEFDAWMTPRLHEQHVCVCVLLREQNACVYTKSWRKYAWQLVL